MGVRQFSSIPVTTPAATSWAGGRFDERDRPHQLLFGRMHEDVEVELAAFRTAGRVFCIASAGCTAIKLAHHRQVVAVDVNPVQLEYVRQRIEENAATRHGLAERFLAFGRMLAPAAGWSKARLQAFVRLDNSAQQVAFWRNYLDTARFRLASDVLLSKPVLRRVYSARLLDCLPSKFAAVLRRRIERCISRHSNRTNPYARAIFTGEAEFERPAAPTATRDIELVQADAAGFLETQPSRSFDGFALSNILDGASDAYAERLFAAVRHAATPDAVVVIRSFREPLGASPTNHAMDDRSMLWGIVDVKPVFDGSAHGGGLIQPQLMPNRISETC